MKKIINILLIFIIVIPMPEILLSQKYINKVFPGSEEWNKYSTTQERIQACNIPENILGDLTTQDLIKSIEFYPFKRDLILSDNIQSCYENMKNNFNGLRELEIRNDAGEIVLKEYLLYNPNIDIEKTMLFEIILSQTSILDKFDINQKNLLMKVSIDYFNYKMDNSYFRIKKNSYKTGALLLARLLDKLNILPEIESLKNNIKFNNFLLNSKIDDVQLLSLILLESINYVHTLEVKNDNQ